MDEEYLPPKDERIDLPELDYTIFYSDADEIWYGLDEHGQFRLRSGDRRPKAEHADDYNYETCGAVLSHTYERYGEKRYCVGMAVSNFDADKEYDAPNRCKKHQGYKGIMDQHDENVKHLAFVESYKNLFSYLDGHEQIIAVEMFKSLINESKYNYDANETELTVDLDDLESTDVAEMVVEFPRPTQKVARGKALWYAALDYVRMENILEEQFRVAAEETGPDGEPLTVGEGTKVVSVSDDGRAIEDTDEHHLNLPLSRIQKDYERHLEVGGVEHDGDDETSGAQAREWVMEISTGGEHSDEDPMTEDATE